MSYPTDGFPISNQRRSTGKFGNPRFILGMVSFLAGLGVMSGVWWVGVGPRQTMSLFWLTTPDQNIYYVEQERSFRAGNLEEAIRASLEQLIQGSGNERLISTLPKETQLLGVKVEGDDIFLNFSPEFTSGGGATSILGRITQVLYTVTSASPQSRVWVSVNGKALQVLGGEGLLLDQPLTRASFEPTFQNQGAPLQINGAKSVSQP